ncbi:MAG: hypothetical protein QXJ06_03390 [Candidatus Aenigmatarchaeota archaeon]
MQWVKKGLIFNPKNRFNWMVSHAQLPVADRIGEDIYRVYFATRDEQNISQIGYIEINMNSKEILYITGEPVLKPGPIGYFDEHGVYPSSIINYDGKKYLYYIGWNRGTPPPLFYASVGLAISEDNGKTFTKFTKAPILSRSEYDPCLVTSPFVMIENEILRMWYTSGIKWEIIDGVLQSYYHIKYAESKDGINWERKGIICIDFKTRNETNIARPCILKENGIYKMWYCYNEGLGYRIGYAISKDGINWIRKDEEAGINVSDSGWDSKSIAYPFVFKHNDKKYMLYNGNNFGREGFGLAVEGE